MLQLTCLLCYFSVRFLLVLIMMSSSTLRTSSETIPSLELGNCFYIVRFIVFAAVPGRRLSTEGGPGSSSNNCSLRPESHFDRGGDRVIQSQRRLVPPVTYYIVLGVSAP